jgi:hypothetical protein
LILTEFGNLTKSAFAQASQDHRSGEFKVSSGSSRSWRIGLLERCGSVDR